MEKQFKKERKKPMRSPGRKRRNENQCRFIGEARARRRARRLRLLSAIGDWIFV